MELYSSRVLWALTALMLLQVGCAVPKFTKGKPSSDYHNGEKFFNPWPVEYGPRKGLLSFLKLRFTKEWNKWPDSVEVTPVKPQKEVSSGAKVTFINHSTFLIQVNGLNILTDPVYSQRVSPFTWIGPKRVHAPAIKYEDLPKIDIVLISHNHYDHMDIETLKALEKSFSPLFASGLGNEALLRESGLINVVEMAWWETHNYKNLKIHFVPSQHFSGRWLDDRNFTLWGGFVVETDKAKKIYFGGDTGYGGFTKEIFNKLGALDIALIPIGAYEPRSFMRPVHNNPDDAVLTHLDLKAKKSIGIHFGTFQLTAEKITDPQEHLKIALEKYKVPQEDFVAPKPGEAYFFDKF